MNPLQEQIAAGLPQGAKVFVFERERPPGTVKYCLLFQFRSRRHIVEDDRPFGEADIPMIIDAVTKWVETMDRPMDQWVPAL